jgi:hypothetical protein
MEVHDYRANAEAREADKLRAFLRAQAAGLTLRPDQPGSRWSGEPAPSRRTAPGKAKAEADFQPGS